MAEKLPKWEDTLPVNEVPRFEDTLPVEAAVPSFDQTSEVTVKDEIRAAIPEIVQQIRQAIIPTPKLAEFTPQQIQQTDPNLTVDVRSMQPPPAQVGGIPLAGNLQPGSVETMPQMEAPEAAAQLRAGQAAVGALARGAAKTGVFAASLANAAALTAIPGQWDKAKAQWQRVAELGDQAPLQEISDALGAAMLVYGGYEGLKAVPALYNLAKNSNVVRKLSIPERGLATIPDDEMFAIYKSAPDEVKKEMATYNPQIRSILLDPAKVQRYSAEAAPAARAAAPAASAAAVPAFEATTAVPQVSQATQAAVTKPATSLPAAQQQDFMRVQTQVLQNVIARGDIKESEIPGLVLDKAKDGITLRDIVERRVAEFPGQPEMAVQRAADEYHGFLRGIKQMQEAQPAPEPAVPAAPAPAPTPEPVQAPLFEDTMPAEDAPGQQDLFPAETPPAPAPAPASASAAAPEVVPVSIPKRSVGKAFQSLVEKNRDTLDGVLMNWNDSRLSEDGSKIVIDIDRRGAVSGSGPKGAVAKSDFFNWLYSDAPFDPKVYGQNIDAEWRGQIESLREMGRSYSDVPARSFASLPEGSKRAFNDAWQGQDVEGMKKILTPANKVLRAEFEMRAGVKLPKGIKATNDFLDGFAKVNAERARRNAVRISELDARIAANEDRIARSEGVRAKEISMPKPAARVAQAGATPRTLDEAIRNFGFPEDSSVSKDMRLYRVVDLFKNMEGGVPEVVKRFRKPGVLGTASNVGKIKLNRLLGMNEDMSSLVLAHEISHVADALYGDTTKTYARGNILGRIGSMDRYIYNNLKNSVMDEAAMVEKMAGVREAALKGVKLEADAQNLKGKARAEFIKGKLSEATKDAFAAQGFISKKEITDELIPLAKWWNSSDMSITRPEELYAEAMSVMLLSPKDLAKRAPKFYAAVSSWLSKKPEFEQAVNDFWTELSKGPEEGIGKLYNQIIDDAHLGEKTRVQTEKNIADSKHILPVKEQAARLYDYTWPLLNRMEELNLKRWDQPFAAVQEANHSAVIIEAYATDIRDKVVRELAKTKALNQDVLHAYLFSERIRRGNYETDAEGNLVVKVGDRALKLNSRGVTQQSAAELQDHIKKLVGDEYTKLQEIAKNLYDEHRKVLERFGEGPFGKELNDKLMDNEAYVTFEPVKYIEEKAGGRAAGAKLIYTSVGDLGPIGNTVVSTVQKDMDLINNLTKYIAREKFFEFGMMANNGMVIPAKTVQGGFFDKPPAHYQTVYWLWDGKMRAMHVHDDYAPIVNGESTEIEKLMGPMNVLLLPFKLMYVNLRAAFFAVNIFKDASSTSLNMPEYKFFSPAQARPGQAFGLGTARAFGLIDAISRSFAEVPEAIKHQTGKATSQAIQEMKRLGIGASHNTETEKELAQAGRGLERLLRQRGILVPGAKFESNLDALGSYLLYAVDVVNASDLATKMAAIKLLKERHPEYTDAHIADIVNTQAGTPDTTNKGLLTPLYNWMYMYSHVSAKGFQGSVRASKEDPKAFYSKLIAHGVVPRMLVWAAKLGLMGAAAKEIYDNIPENFLAGYVNIPLGKTKQGKSVHVTISQDEATRVAGGLTYYMLKNMDPADRKDLLENLSDAILNGFDYAQNQMPGFNPVIKMGGQLSSMWNLDKGKGPTGGFGQDLVPERIRKEWPERRGRAWGRLGAETWNNTLGMGQFYRFSDNPDEIQSTLEQITNRTPLLGDMLRRFVRVSAAGKATDAYEAKQDVAAANAATSNDRIQRMIGLRNDFLKENDREPAPRDVYAFYQQMKRDMPKAMRGISVADFRRSYAAYTVGAKGTEGRVQAVFKAGSNEAKAAALEQLSKEMSPADLSKVIKQARRDRMLSPKAIQIYRRAQRKPE